MQEVGLDSQGVFSKQLSSNSRRHSQPLSARRVRAPTKTQTFIGRSASGLPQWDPSSPGIGHIFGSLSVHDLI